MKATRQNALSISAAVLVLLLAGAGPEESPDSPEPTLLSGKKFDEALREPGPAANWSNVDLRSILHEVSDQRQISIVLDRRVDPTGLPTISLVNGTLFESLSMIAGKVSATACVARNVVVIGPPEPLAKLRTLIQLRLDELFRDAKVSEGRRLELGKAMTLQFGDLHNPAELLDAIGKQFSLDIEGRELVPYDLWAGATFPEVDAISALTLVLNQFDLTFEWKDQARAIKIVPVPEVVHIERKYQTRGTPAEKDAESWKERFEGIETEVRGNEIVVRGTLEQQEQLIAQLRPHTERTPKSKTGTQPVPLSKREFTLTMRRVPADELMKKLEEKGIKFDYDRDVLTAAGVDLKTSISVNVKQVQAEEFFHAIFDQLKLSFTIDNATVKLKPQ